MSKNICIFNGKNKDIIAIISEEEIICRKGVEFRIVDSTKKYISQRGNKIQLGDKFID